MKKVLILGSTGSIGRQTLDIIERHSDKFRVVGLCCNSNYGLLNEQIKRFAPDCAAIADERFRDRVIASTRIYSGGSGILDMCRACGAEIVVAAMVGLAGLEAVLACIEAGMTIALANKETLVGGGRFVMSEIKRTGCGLYPVDSEHSAIFQCLQNDSNKRAIMRLVLTASGGPFIDYTPEQMEKITVEQALKHPNWSMGSKITIDSATMMNKGLEVIEAHWLFGVPADKIDVAIQRKSIVHSMVEFEDHSLLAQMGLPDMHIPIQYALTYPERIECISPRMDLFELAPIVFEKPDMKRFPALQIAYDALCVQNGKTVVINAANEVAVSAFLDRKISYMDVMRIVEKAYNKMYSIDDSVLENIKALDTDTRDYCAKIIS